MTSYCQRQYFWLFPYRNKLNANLEFTTDYTDSHRLFSFSLNTYNELGYWYTYLFHHCQRQYTNPYILHIYQTGSTCQSSRTSSQHIVNYQYVFPCKCFGMLKFKDTFHIIPTFKHRFTRLRFRIFLILNLQSLWGLTSL